MSRRPRRNHSPAFKSKVSLAAIKGEHTITELSQRFDVHPNQTTQWKTQLQEQASIVFDPGGSTKEPSVDIKTLHAKIGELTLEKDLGAVLNGASLSQFSTIFAPMRSLLHFVSRCCHSLIVFGSSLDTTGLTSAWSLLNLNIGYCVI